MSNIESLNFFSSENWECKSFNISNFVMIKNLTLTYYGKGDLLTIPDKFRVKNSNESL
jgi:hypothetical protein